MDDDQDCVEHVWRLEAVHLKVNGAEMTYECRRCGATSLRPSAVDREGDRRPRAW